MTLKKRLLELKPVYFYHLLFAYVLVSILWWSYLLIYNNRQNYLNDKALIEQIDSGRDESISVNNIYQDFLRKQILIIVEALSFFVLVVLGARRVFRSQQKAIELARQQSNFLLSITHELKSPLSGIQLTLETLAKHKLPAREEKRFIANAMDDTGRLKKLIEDILLAAKFEDEAFRVAHEPFDISELLRQIVDDYSLKTKRIKHQIDSGLILWGDENLLEMAIRNLIENALKYSKSDAGIELNCHKYDSCIKIEIADSGPGISNKEKQHVFKKFYRIGDENTRQQKGTGLGLYIVKEIVKHHKGEINIEDNKPNGVVFSMSLPLFLH